MQRIKIKGAYITPTKTAGTEKPITLTGCIYDSNKRKICLSERSSGHKGDFYQSINPESLPIKNHKDLETLLGKSVYLGHLMNHYGHFITETISTFWLLLEEHCFDHYIFHSFEGSSSIPNYATHIIDAFKIPKSKILIINTPLKLEEVVIPERLVQLNFKIDRNMLEVYSYLKEFILTNFPVKIKNHELLYLSRLKTSKRKINRIIINEADIEEYFKRLGFKILYLEEMPFNQQISIFNQAKIIVGFSGSALHNCVFTNIKTQIIELSDIRSGQNYQPMQVLCNELANTEYTHIPFRGFILNKKRNIGFADLAYIKQSTVTLTNTKKFSSRHFLTHTNLFSNTLQLFIKSVAKIFKHTIKLRCEKLKLLFTNA